MCSFTREETGSLGKWREFIDSQSQSYDHLTSSELLSRVAGFASLQDYKPWWVGFLPPDDLVDEVFHDFKGLLEAAQEVLCCSPQCLSVRSYLWIRLILVCGPFVFERLRVCSFISSVVFV